MLCVLHVISTRNVSLSTTLLAQYIVLRSIVMKGTPTNV